ncbi:MAG: hypothetical protein NZ703_03710 [Gemmataceae bacterium]|nr:hypothetical protein [Gemmataceae bacterium]MCS7270169.1 hypothetical protein [Gemmataceae bacterium]MDW8244441.1 hypothetical protein [Thermogemmata sp.]
MSESWRCRQFRRAVLALPDPRQPWPTALRRHSQVCVECQLWAEQARELEEALRRLPVPAAPNGKAQLLALLQVEGRTGNDPQLPQRRAVSRWTGWHLAGWVSLAAAVLVAVVVYRWPAERTGQQPPVVEPPPYLFLRQVVDHDVALARAHTAEQRLRILTSLAETLVQETQALARIAAADELRDLVRWYDKVIERGVLVQAGEWAAQMQSERDRQPLLESAHRLAATAQAVEQLLGDVPPHAQPVLRQLVRSARQGEDHLKRLSGV